MSIEEIKNNLIKHITDNLRYYIELTWDKNLGSIHIFTKKSEIYKNIVKLSKNYTNYYKKEYKVKEYKVKEIINRNPHIKIILNNKKIL